MFTHSSWVCGLMASYKQWGENPQVRLTTTTDLTTEWLSFLLNKHLVLFEPENILPVKVKSQ
jgi:hypothetical protein